MTLRPWLVLVPGLLAVALLAGCGGGGGGASITPTITIQPARVYRLSGFMPTHVARAGVPTKVSFTIVTPEGKPLTQYRHGLGPHNGVHLIFVRTDLGAIVHRHPPIGADGKITDSITFPTIRLRVPMCHRRGGSWLCLPPKKARPPRCLNRMAEQSCREWC